jgi:hypothetical protein
MDAVLCAAAVLCMYGVQSFRNALCTVCCVLRVLCALCAVYCVLYTCRSPRRPPPAGGGTCGAGRLAPPQLHCVVCPERGAGRRGVTALNTRGATVRNGTQYTGA